MEHVFTTPTRVEIVEVAPDYSGALLARPVPVDETAAERMMSAWQDKYPGEVRDLVMTISRATNEPDLDDDESPYAHVFREAVDLYAHKHGISHLALAGALCDWRDVESAFSAASAVECANACRRNLMPA